jgi:hypothetical protein
VSFHALRPTACAVQFASAARRTGCVMVGGSGVGAAMQLRSAMRPCVRFSWFVGVIGWCASVVPRASALATRSNDDVCIRDYSADCPVGAAAHPHSRFSVGRGGAGFAGWAAVGDASRCVAPVGYEGAAASFVARAPTVSPAHQYAYLIEQISGPCGPILHLETHRGKIDVARQCKVSCAS